MSIAYNPIERNGNKYFTCINCGEEKKLTNEFWRKCKRLKMGFHPKCKECLKKMEIEYRNTHRDSIRENANRYARRWRAEHKEEEREKRLEYYRTHKDYIAEKSRRYRNENRDKIREYRKNRRFKDKETRKLWIENNRESIYLKGKKRVAEKGYMDAHLKTMWVIKKKGIRPKCCSLCGCEGYIVSHHPNYEEWNRVVFCCNSCHRLIHMGLLNIPKEKIVTICECIGDKRAVRCDGCGKLIPKVTSTKYCDTCRELGQKKRV